MDWKNWAKNTSQYPEVQHKVEGCLTTLIETFFPQKDDYVIEKFIKSYTEGLRAKEKNMLYNEGIDHKHMAKSYVAFIMPHNQKTFVEKYENIKKRMLSEVSRETRHYALFLSSVQNN